MDCCCCEGEEEWKKSENIAPERPRGCTDILALIIFIIFWFGMIVIAAFSVVQGDPWRLVYGSDSFGNTCGKRNSHVKGLNMSGMDLRNKSYLLPMDVTNPFESLWICVERCPEYSLYRADSLKHYAETRGAKYCIYDLPLEEYPSSYLNDTVPFSNLGPCPVLPVYESVSILHRCVPSSAVKLSTEILSRIFGFLNGIDVFQQVFSDLVISYKEILIMCVVAFVIALLIVFIIRFVAGVVVYLTFALVILAGLGISIALWYSYVMLRLHLDATDLLSNGTRLLVSDTKNEHTLLIYAILSTLVTFILSTVIVCLWRSAKLVVDLFREAGRCLQATPCLLLQPLYTFVALMMLFIYWSLVVLMLATATHMSKAKAVSLPPAYVEFVLVEFNVSSAVRYMWWYHAIGLIWTAEFILACQQLVVASSVALWYFSRLKESKVPCASYCLKCCICCLWCVERCCKYWHHNAYTIIASHLVPHFSELAIEGRSFCPAAKQAFEILANNVAHVSTINLVGDFVLFLGKCGVTALTGLLALLVFKGNDQLHFYCIPLLLVCVFAFFIAHCFFSVYEMAIDTLFLCYCADRDFSDRSGNNLYADSVFINFMARMKRLSDGPDFEEGEMIPMNRIDL